MGTLPDSNRLFPPHPTEEILEAYVFHRLSEPLVAQVEEHLLICPQCQDVVAESDQFVSAFQAAGRFPVPATGLDRWGWWNGLNAAAHFAQKTSLAPIFALVILALVVVWKHPTEAPPPVAVSLSSLRGADPLAPAPAGRPLQLSIESPDLAPGLTSGREYRVELVDAAGRPVWKGGASTTDGKLIARMSKPLSSGVYWVRLYGANSELLREFGLSAK